MVRQNPNATQRRKGKSKVPFSRTRKRAKTRSQRKQRIPATQGSTAITRSGDKVEVVLPTETKIIRRDKPGTAKELKALREEVSLLKSRARPSRAVYNQLPTDLSRVGGYTGLTEGYGVRPNPNVRIDSRIDNVEKKLDKLLQRQNNPSVDLKPNVVVPPTSTPKPATRDVGTSQFFDMIAKERNATAIQSAVRRRQAQKIREQRQKDLDNRLRLQRETEELGNEILKIAKDKTLEEAEKQRKIDETKRRNRERVRRIDFKLAEEEARKREKQRQKETEEFEKQERLVQQSLAKEDEVRQPTGFQQQLDPSQIVSEFDIRNRQRSQFGDEARIQQRLGEIQETQQEIEGTTRQLVESLQEEEDDTLFSDVVSTEIPSQPTPLQPDTEEEDISIPVEPSVNRPNVNHGYQLNIPSTTRSSVSTQTTATAQGSLSSRARQMAIERARPLRERRATRSEPIRPKPAPPSPPTITLEPEPQTTVIETPPTTPAVPKVPSPISLEPIKSDTTEPEPEGSEEEVISPVRRIKQQKRVSESELSQARRGLQQILNKRPINRDLESGLDTANRLERARQEEARRQRVRIESAVKIQQLARQRQAKREAGFLRQTRLETQEAMRGGGQGRSVETLESFAQKVNVRPDEIPQELKNALKSRNSVADEQQRLLRVLINSGLNGKTIQFGISGRNQRQLTARDLVSVEGGFARDTQNKRTIIENVRTSRNPEVRRQLPEIERTLNQFFKNKRDIKTLQNKISAEKKKLSQ